VPKLPLAAIINITKDTEKELRLRKLCMQYLLVEYLQQTYNQSDHVIFESIEDEEEKPMDRQLANFVLSLKEYSMGEIRVAR
jgi:hypothetical protein